MMIAETHASTREFGERGRVLLGGEVRAHSIPDDENDMTRRRLGARARGGETDRGEANEPTASHRAIILPFAHLGKMWRERLEIHAGRRPHILRSIGRIGIHLAGNGSAVLRRRTRAVIH